MLNVIRNRFLRIPDKLHIMIIAVVVMPLFIGAAIFFSGHITTTYKIAFVTDDEVPIPESKSVQVEMVNERPETSSLAMGKYTAFVEVNEEGNFIVTTLKGEEDKKAIQTFFETGKLPEKNISEQRGIGTNILGFVLVLAFMQGVALTTFYPEDRHNLTFKRILTSPVGAKQYLIAQGIFTFLCLYVPTFLVIAITKICFGVDIGFGLGVLAVLLAILAVLATAFSLFMASIMERNISLATSGITIITSILAGCFFTFAGNGQVFEILTNLLPQKSFMILAQDIENGKSLLDIAWPAIFITAWIVELWLIGSMVTSRKVRKGVFS